MEKAEYDTIFRNEDNHFFYTSTHYLVTRLAKKYFPKQAKVLDIGCGTGRLAQLLNKRGFKVIGLDSETKAIKYSKSRHVSAKLGTIQKMPFKSNSFAAATCIDVLVHKSIKDDRDALKRIHRILKPNGYLIIRVSANPWLKQAHDKFVHSVRRYTREQLEKKLTQAGFETIKITYIHAPLLLVAVVLSVWQRLFNIRAKSGIFTVPQTLNTLASSLLILEAKLASIVDLPFGLGLIIVAKKVTGKSKT